jgi:hypothetical protein
VKFKVFEGESKISIYIYNTILIPYKTSIE